jgi:hypothetical protein
MLSFVKWLTPRRIRAHAIVFALCLWGVCAADFLTPGSFDRAANIKFQDFLSFYISARLIHQGRGAELYDDQARTKEMFVVVHPIDVAHEIALPPTARTPNVRLPNLYGPQVALCFVPLTRFSYLLAAQICATLGLLVYFICIYLIWKKSCPALRPYGNLVAICALAFPPLFHLFVRGQISALLLACFTAAYFALRSGRPWLAGIALGFLVLKPQFLIAIPFVLVLAGEWGAFGGLILSGGAQLLFARIYFGSAVMHSYLDMIEHPSRWIDVAELSLSPIQMHSLRAFWDLLLPSAALVLVLYFMSSLFVLGMTVAIWKSSSPLALRFSALAFAAVLVSPHLFIYDLLVLAPALLLLVNWGLLNPAHPLSPALQMLSYFAFVLPLFGPLSRWTHLQLSVLCFATIVWLLYRFRSLSQPLASSDSGVV